MLTTTATPQLETLRDIANVFKATMISFERDATLISKQLYPTSVKPAEKRVMSPGRS